MKKLIPCIISVSVLMLPTVGKNVPDKIVLGDTPEAFHIETAEENIETVQEVAPTVISIGVCKLSAYCKENYPHNCNNGNSSATATGTVPMAGRTVAVDPKIIPYGSKVIINGHTYIAEDCGGAIKGNRVDILFDTHQEALNFGIQYSEVFVVTEDK